MGELAAVPTFGLISVHYQVFSRILDSEEMNHKLKQ